MAALPPAAGRAQVGCGGLRVVGWAPMPSADGARGRWAQQRQRAEAWLRACRALQAEDILHGAGEQSCLPLSTGRLLRGNHRSSCVGRREVSARCRENVTPWPGTAGRQRCLPWASRPRQRE